MAIVLNKVSLRNLIQHNVDKGLIILANTLEYSVTSLLDGCSVEIFMDNNGELEETRMWIEDGLRSSLAFRYVFPRFQSCL